MYKSKQNLDILYRAFDEYCKYYMTTLPSEEELQKITFSPEFESKIQKLIGRQKKPYFYMINTVAKRVACIIVACLAVLTTLTFSVKAIREPVIKFFVDTYKKFSTIFFEAEYINEDYNQGITTYYEPTYLPKGYVEENVQRGATVNYIEYCNSANGSITFHQYVINPSSIYIDTENAKTTFVNNNTAYSIEKDDTKCIVWNDDNYSYILTTPSNLSDDELFKIANSVGEIK